MLFPPGHAETAKVQALISSSPYNLGTKKSNGLEALVLMLPGSPLKEHYHGDCNCRQRSR